MKPSFFSITLNCCPKQKGLFPCREEAEKFCVPFSSSSVTPTFLSAIDLRSWNWHLATSNAFEAGCRGVTGPVPQPLNMRFVISTNADRLISKSDSVNRFLGFSYRNNSTNAYSRIHEIPENFALLRGLSARTFVHCLFTGAGSEAAGKFASLAMEDPGQAGHNIFAWVCTCVAG